MDERDECHLINEMKTNRETTLGGLTTFMSDTLGHPISNNESRFMLFSRDGNTRVWRYPQEKYREEFIRPRLQCDGGSIMVWGCYAYMDLMKRKLLPFMESLSENNDGEFIYQEDNASCHKSKVAEDSDLSPIENLWAYLTGKVKARVPSPKNLNELERAIHIE
ncbi:hypothetical protein PHYBLDRAFT_159508 [Phycomyces blakesleeanus NRRL 1555(-)]|uniref:Tc1-like transposase DDE domain-containing protein n=1 Tax=Phycomyces blakesleeanus (strain ATCC 8743b / DSM 1359 / FGSC 10004 / NBRC 33097 / NRRL 1555) TaxID=763407 RepID=A0A167LS45_PHYB8|nr:hypothetical protein PHYBLDRAFT_159508 [Phycomyces blakesleeanus NRRL 1555(-)]OAD70984.1 hypothetical protein PHYBLDRAFT_159508 [Phycomyces blakesleeanus NRRL 1555(-)]|eukprot:XP_018289024.1 hypothetical protein PHYBLDRAFT_159508 [Phycomyces blakesleeanus NRRL 1555(-)]